VIGVVAAMSLPSLLNSTNKQESVVALKKASATLSNAMNLYMSNNGCVGDIRSCTTFPTSSILFNVFKSNLNIQKDCGTVSGGGCFPAGVSHKSLAPSFNWGPLDNDVTWYKAILTDGTLIMMSVLSSNCSYDNSKSNQGPLFQECGIIYIDINGAKGPNQVGRDFFEFDVTNSGLYPAGIPDDSTVADSNGKPGCDPASPNVLSGGAREGWGSGCTAKVLQEGAMNY